jgi:hypothetical protein
MGFSNGYALVWKDGVWKYINKQGNLASERSFSTASQFHNNQADVSISGELYKFVNAGNIDNEKYRFDSKRDDFINGYKGEL